jgi:very-short-patch-repair endonuclease
MGGRCDTRVSELAERQAGVVSRAQVLALGVGDDAITAWLRNGRLRRVRTGVYAPGHRALPADGELWAAVLATDGVVSHRSAAAKLDLLLPPSTIHVTVPTHRRHTGGLRVHRAPLAPDEVIDVDGLRVTSVLRTLVDLASGTPARLYERALNQAWIVHRFRDLAALEAAAAGRRGARMVRRAIEDGSAGTDSELEERLVALVRRAGLPRPEHQVHVGVHRVDFLWRAQRLIVEVDGMATHLTPRAFQADRTRDRELRRLGYRVERFTWRDVTRDAPATAQTLRAILAA